MEYHYYINIITGEVLNNEQFTKRVMYQIRSDLNHWYSTDNRCVAQLLAQDVLQKKIDQAHANAAIYAKQLKDFHQSF